VEALEQVSARCVVATGSAATQELVFAAVA